MPMGICRRELRTTAGNVQGGMISCRWRLLVVLWLAAIASTGARAPVPRYYSALGVNQDAIDKEIRKAYRALAVTRHPDKITTGQSTSEERESAQRDFVELAKAYEVLSDDVGRKRYDYWTSEGGPDAAYPDGSFDWSLIDQQLGLASMHHRDKSGATEAAGSRVWSMEEAEQLFRETEILSKREHDDDDGEDSNATVNMLAVLGLGITTAASILIPLYISWNRTRAKHDEKARKKQPTTEQKAELAARRAAVSKREAEEQAQKRVKDEQKKSMKKKKGEKERGGGEEDDDDDNRRQKTWPRFDDTDPFLRRIQWIEHLTYEQLLQSLHPHTAADDATQASAAADVLTKFQTHLGEDAYEGVAHGLTSVVLEAHSTRARGVDVAALEELVGRWFDAESPVRVKLDDKWEWVLKDSVSALVAMDEDDDGADEEEDDADDDEEKRQAAESAVADALDKLTAAALDRLKQGGGKLKGIKDHWASFWSSEDGHRARESAVQLEDVLESDIATNAFAEHLEFEGAGGDLELYFELAAATDADDAEQRKEAALGMLDRFFSEDAEGPLPSVAEDLEGVAEDLRALVEDDDDDREEEAEEQEEELVVPLLQDMLAHTRESLVESLASFTSHVYRPMGGGKAEKSKGYARLLKAAHAVVGSVSATQGGGGGGEQA